jgi:hypothetical protein
MNPALTKLLALVATSATLFLASVFISDFIKARLRFYREQKTKEQYARLETQGFFGTLIVFHKHFKGAMEKDGKRIEFELKKNKRSIEWTHAGATLSWPTCSIRINLLETTFVVEDVDEIAIVKTFFQPGSKIEITEVE